MDNIYVLDKSGEPLMPMHHYGRAKRILKQGKATIVKIKPFTIRLTYEIENPVTDVCIYGNDPGRTNLGACVTDSKGNILCAAKTETRNKEIAKLMLDRKSHRQASRRGERLRKQRRAVKSGLSAHTEYIRMLPHYETPITCKVIRNTEARFCNRKRPKGWLTPTANQLLQTHLNLLNEVSKILPINMVVLEINRFDFARMENPNIQNWKYQKGRLFGFKNVHEAVAYRQNNHCLFCRNAIDHDHHVVPKHLGGSESVDNYTGLCKKHHVLVHTETEWQTKLQTKQKGLLKKYHALSVINQIMPYLVEEIAKRYPLYVTTGYETKTIRESCGLEKDHHIDAWCIAVSVLNDVTETPDFDNAYQIKQYRRHNRSNINNQRERTYYLNGEMVAKNRHKRFEQTSDSLEEFAQKPPAEVAKLTVQKSIRRYNTKGRMLPGTVFIYKGKRHVMSGQLSNGQYLRAVGDTKTNYPAKECRMIQCGGLVYI